MDERPFRIEADAVCLTKQGPNRTKPCVEYLCFCVSGCLVCAQVEEKGQRGQLDDGEEPRPSVVGVPGLTAKSDWKPPPETQQQVIEFRKCQAEERKVKKNKKQRPPDQAEAALHSASSSSSSCAVQMMELERQREKERADLDQINLGRTALLLERQQARMNKTLRQQLDSTNVQLAQIQKEQ